MNPPLLGPGAAWGTHMDAERALAVAAVALVALLVAGAAGTFLLRAGGDAPAVVGLLVAVGLVAVVSVYGRRGLGETPYW